MKKICGIVLVIVTFFSSTLGVIPTDSGITLIGIGVIPGTALDKSGLTGEICQASNLANCVSSSLFGGFGSALAYTGHGNYFVAAPDRGPFDGLTDVPYLDRIHYLKISTDINAPFPNIKTELVDTRLLKNWRGESFVGATGAYDVEDKRKTLRLDPEGIRLGIFGNMYISDEYGPYVYEFSRFGRLLRRINVPSKFEINYPNENPENELLFNISGRQANRGTEGLAISPDNRYLFGIMQSALIQDNGLTPGTTSRLGLNNRILKIDLRTKKTQEFVYTLDAINRGQGVSEILAINDHEFLVLERDNRSNLQSPPQPPTRKKIYKIDISGATDVSDIESLPAGQLPPEIVPVTKTLFIDLLDSAFNLTPTIAEKVEGLAWGPDLLDGRHLLYVISDNDLNQNLDTQIYAFAIDPSLINLKKQFLPIPVCGPHGLKR